MKKEEASAQPSTEQQKLAQEAPAEDPVQKELEAKKKETIDLTVSHVFEARCLAVD